MPSIKSYQRERSVIVQYFDSGIPSLLRCPSCAWFGEVPDFPFLDEVGTIQCSCQDCTTSLALVYASR